MANRYLYPLVAILVVGVLVGIGAEALKDTHNPAGATETPENSEDGHGALQRARILSYPGSYDELGNNTLPVRLRIQVGGYPEFTYEDVQLCLYDSEGEVLDHRTIGTIRSPEDGEFDEEYRITPQTDRRPTYIVVDHPELRNDSRFGIYLRYWENGEQRLTYESLDEIQDDFEWPRTHEVGTCG